MKRTLLTLAAISCLFIAAPIHADRGEGENEGKTQALAVIGDWPYSQGLLDSAPMLVTAVNADRDVKTVLHVGDIHSGSMPCTGAGLVPIPAGSVPGWNQGVFDVFQQFNAPLVYTPGDNEWADCHKKKEFFSGAPLNELAAVRGLFFANPGFTLGQNPMKVQSQAKSGRNKYPADAQFVENVRWERGDVLFVTMNLPGSNNDTLPWTGVFSNTAAQAREVAERDAANLRWLNAAFEQAREEHAKAIVIGVQANMWDPEALAVSGDGLGAYTPFVNALADLSARFGRPVLLINGDTHVFGVDQPLADPNSFTGMIHHARAVPNLTRITLEGAATVKEWLKLKIDTRTPGVFSWERVTYLP
jgi:hypothetical protein